MIVEIVKIEHLLITIEGKTEFDEVELDEQLLDELADELDLQNEVFRENILMLDYEIL
jgi:hypothetical protein